MRYFPSVAVPVLLALVCSSCASTSDAPEAAQIAAAPEVLEKNGGWCWFQDERAILSGGKLIFGSVAGVTRDGSTKGDVKATSYDLATGERTSFTLAPEFQSDDHDAPAFLELPGGRILAGFMTHGGRATKADTRAMYWRVTRNPHDISEWGETQKADVGGDISYVNLFRLSAEGGRIYNFHRNGRGSAGERNPHFMVSDDNAVSFRYGGRLLYWPRPGAEDPKFTGIDGGRPYLKYAASGGDTIHFIASEDHPRAYDNSIWHGYFRQGKIYSSDGTLIAAVGDPTAAGDPAPRPTALTRVFAGTADGVAWPIDLHVDPQGNPYCLFSIQRDGAQERSNRGATNIGQDHRYGYARWDGKQWNAREIAYAGTRLYPGEDDYTGLGALDPGNPNRMYISTDADPSSGAPLISKADGKRHYEIFRGDSAGNGTTWTWTAITRDSEQDQLRPVVPIGDRAAPVVLWLRGHFRTYTDYDLDIVGLVR